MSFEAVAIVGGRFSICGYFIRVNKLKLIKRVGCGRAEFPTYTEFFGEYRLPTEEEGHAFVAEYEAARGRPFTREEYQTLKAAKIYGLAYGARCEHALHPHDTIYPEGSCRTSLAQYRSISPLAE